MSEPTIADLAEGQTGWIVPWALYVDLDLRMHTTKDVTISEARGGTVCVEITNTGNGRYHATLSEPFQWTPGPVPHGSVPVSFTLPACRDFVANGDVLEGHYPHAENNASPTTGDVLPEYALKLTVATLPAGRMGWTTPWELYPMTDGSCLINDNAELDVTGGGTGTVEIRRDANGTLIGRFTAEPARGGPPRGDQYSRVRIEPTAS